MKSAPQAGARTSFTNAQIHARIASHGSATTSGRSALLSGAAPPPTRRQPSLGPSPRCSLAELVQLQKQQHVLQPRQQDRTPQQDPTAHGRPQALTRSLRDARSLQEVDRALRGTETPLDHIHISALMMALARHARRHVGAAASAADGPAPPTPSTSDPGDEAQLLAQLRATALAQLRQQLDALQPRQLSNVLYALAQLSDCGEPSGGERLLIDRLLRRAAPQARGFTPQGLSTVLWAAARLRRPLPAPWLGGWVAACATALEGFGPADLAATAWALARLAQEGHPLHARFLRQFVAAAQRKMPSCSPAELVILASGLAASGAPAPPPAWRKQLGALTRRHLHSLSPQQLCMLAGAFGHWRALPGRAWAARLQRACERQRRGGALTAQGACTLLWALSRASLGMADPALCVRRRRLRGARGYPTAAARGLTWQRGGQHTARRPRSAAAARLPRRWSTRGARGAWALRPWARALSQHLAASQLSLEDASMALTALGHLGRDRAHPPLAAACVAATAGRLAACSGQQLANMAWALGRLRAQLPGSWAPELLAALRQRMCDLDARQLTMVLWGLAQLQVLPDVRWLADALDHAASILPSFHPAALAALVWALGRLSVKPPKEWMGLVLAEAQRKLVHYDQRALARLITGVALMRYRPGNAWLQQFAGCVAARLARISPPMFERIVGALRQLDFDARSSRHGWLVM